MVDIDFFTVIALNKMVLYLGYTSEYEPLFYNYVRPLSSLDEGLYTLACEEDVRCLGTHVRSFKLLEVYIEHGYMIVSSYQRPPPYFRATTEDISQPSTSAEKENKSDKLMLLTWHDFSTPAKDYVCESVTPRSMPQHDFNTHANDSICDSITPRHMPHGTSRSSLEEEENSSENRTTTKRPSGEQRKKRKEKRSGHISSVAIRITL
ncbi:hypothetical protein Tco_1501433 [Tanacetum coccineum]